MADKTAKKLKKNKILLSILLTSIFLFSCGFFYYKNFYPNQILNLGKKYFEIRQFDSALNIFKYVEKLKPYDIEPLYYETVTLAKMPPVYKNQKRLYEISQYDDSDEASKLASSVINNIVKQIYLQAGPNYIDNVLFDNKILRWNNNYPINYSIQANNNINREFYIAVSKAFQEWQSITNGEYQFIKSSVNPNIVIHVVNKFPEYKHYVDKEPTAIVIPNVIDNRLIRMDIYIKSVDENGNKYSNDKLYSLLLHEIGHALGIGSHSNDKNDVMYYDGDLINDNMLKKSISRKDLSTLTILYKMVPDAINIKINDKIKNNLLYSKLVTTYIGENYTNEINRLINQIKQEKKNPDDLIETALNYGKTEQYSRANYILESVLPMLTKDENKFEIYYNIALNNYKMKKYKAALKSLKLAESIKTDNKTKILNVFLEIKTGNIKTAKENLTVLYEENPNNIEIAVKLAEIYTKEGKKREKRAVIDKLIKLNPEAKKDKRVIKYKK